MYSQNARLKIKNCESHMLLEIFDGEIRQKFKKNRQISIYGSSR
jgi:hypothetical protein